MFRIRDLHFPTKIPHWIELDHDFDKMPLIEMFHKIEILKWVCSCLLVPMSLSSAISKIV